MRSLLKYASMLGFAITILSLTACSGQPNFDVTLDNGSDLAVETNYTQLTNQEMFELVAGGYLGGINPGVLTILNWADDIILSDLVEIDEESLEQEREMVESFFDEESELQEFLTTQGFDDLDAYLATFRLSLMREQAAFDAAAAQIDEDDILEIYNTYFAANVDESDEDADEDEDSDFEDDIEDDVQTFEDLRDSIEEVLINEILQEPEFEPEVLANLRAEAGLTIYSSYFATRYENFLSSLGFNDIDVATGNNNDSVVASINGQYLTSDEMFDMVVAQFALNGQLLDYIDRNILNEIYNIDRDVIRTNVSQAKINMGDWFYLQMEAQGLFTERQIFNHFLLGHLQSLVFDENFLPISDERLQELYELHVEGLTATFEAENTPERGVRHILISEDDERTLDEARELAEYLIAQLQEADADEVEALLSELAEEYSTCPSSENGGDLGIFGLGRMVSEFEEATFALELYEFTTEPVETVHGFHVIYLYYIEELDVETDLSIPTFEEVRATLIENETQRIQMNQHYFANVMFDIREDHNIRFHNERLQLQYDTVVEQTRRRIDED